MENPENNEKKIRGGIIAQVAVLFLIGTLALGLTTFFLEQFLSEGTVKSQVSDMLDHIAAEVVVSVNEYPANEWLLDYWYENADEMDIEYDADYRPGTETEKKAAQFTQEHPDIQIEY
ncbi:MAG: hypothetical protein IJI04_04920, partial [Lachnospiraceae bacterium]|nr:hypothetical protein [Lachnospiraceae bacterium]